MSGPEREQELPINDNIWSGSPPLSLVRPALGELKAYRTAPDPAPIKLDANESPWRPSPALRQRWAEALSEAPLNRYPDPRATALRSSIARLVDAEAHELVLGVGSDEVIAFLMTAIGGGEVGQSATALLPSPGFVMYPITAKVHGLRPVEVPLLPNWQLDVPAMLTAIERDKPALIFLASPNNPTGNSFARADLQRIIDAASNSLVVIDEAYGAFSEHVFKSSTMRANVATLGTLSKIGLAGLRVGWVRMHPTLAHEVEKVRPPYNLSAPTQLCAQLALDHAHASLEASIEAVKSERARVYRLLGEIAGVDVFPSDANFHLLRVSNAPELHGKLLERGVQVRIFKGDCRLHNHLRVTIGTRSENDAFLSALECSL